MGSTPHSSLVLSDLFLTPGGKLPMYCYSTKVNTDASCISKEKEPSSPFLDFLFKEWEERKRRGLFHHDISKCQTKILPGNYGFIATLIEGRDQRKRPTEFKIDQVLQPFNKEKFNFTKVGQEEVIFQFEESNSSQNQYNATAPIDSSSPNIILINVSPIGYGHVLLIPHLLDCLSQRIDRDSFYVAICVAREARSPFFRVGYNSLGGFATINHLHFQAYYLEEEFPVEKASTKKISTLENKVNIYELTDYPVRGLVFEGESKLNSSLNNLCDTVSISCILLQEGNKPFNVLISDSGKKIFLLLQCYANKLAMGEVRQEFIEKNINPAVWELSGHLVLKRRRDYEEASEMKIIDFLSEVTLSESEFQEAKKMIMSSFLDI
ncbi:hypothetical protein LUZ60_013344 [Juncus effusus]|nr:hypothetical protein LUZ60_013344 [Juncus effusus]